MRVSDDGCGMEPEDLPVAIRRHATSKIKDAADLESILTLGFRGEALAAIASVSDLRILSKQREADMGAVLEARGGNIISLTEVGCPNGTTVIVEALFANVPARRKFLKRDVTEAQAVTAAVERVALSHPEISFKLIVDGDIKLHTAGDGKLQSAIYAVFGKEFASRLIPLDGDYEGIRVSGFIGRSDNVKGTRNYQNFFINGRWVKSKTAMAALEQAFCSYLPPDKYPTCVMQLSLNPARVDVNVHPAKLEVKFSNEKMIFEAIYYTVKNALEQDESRPEMKINAPAPTARPVSNAFAPVTDGRKSELSLAKRQLTMDTPPIPKQEITTKPQAPSAAPVVSTAAPAPKKQDTFVHLTAEEYVRTYLGGKAAEPPVKMESQPQRVPSPVQTDSEPPKATPPESPMSVQMPPAPVDIPMPSDADVPPVKQAPEEPKQDAPAEQKTPDSWRIVGEVFHSYVIVEVGERMLLIDKHAAHERILFEQLKEKLHAAEPASQLLMLPIEVMMMSDEVQIVEEYRPELSAIGFEYTTARNTVSVSALPIGIDAGAAGDMLCAIADRIKNSTGSAALTRDIIFEKALYQGACKAAIKAGRVYAEGHIEWLVAKLMALPNITACPHGRPVAMEMSKRNLDHQFERS
jgi:DNA mismatch repair protein MutL